MLVFLLVMTTHAGTIRVPWDFLTIQDAINAAADGDTVLVADGTYRGEGNRNISVSGKAILVCSENGAENCIIDCEADPIDSGRGFVFKNGEGENSILRGFTITNGYISGGAGIGCMSVSLTISDCIITGNRTRSNSHGGGIYASDSCITLNNCVIENNFGADAGGGSYFVNCDLNLTDCAFIGNSTNGSGGGIYIVSCEHVVVKDCIFEGNRAENGGGIRVYEAFPVELERSVFIGNTATVDGGGLLLDTRGTVRSCHFAGNSALRGGGLAVNPDRPITIGGAAEYGNFFEDNVAASGADMFAQIRGDRIINAQHNVFSGCCFSDYYISSAKMFNLENSTSYLIPIAQDVYVSPAGDDGNDGLTPETPFKTIMHAMQTVLGSDDQTVTVHLLPGVYSQSQTGETYPLPFVETVRIAGQDRETVVIDAETDELFFFGYAETIDISGVTFTKARNDRQYGTFVCVTSDIAISDCRFTDNGSNYGGIINLCNSSGCISRCELDNNSGNVVQESEFFIGYEKLVSAELKIEHTSIIQNDGNAIFVKIYFEPSINYVITNSTLSDNSGCGITNDQSVTSGEFVVEKCTIKNNRESGIYLEYLDFLDIRECVISSNQANGIRGYELPVVIDRCLLESNCGGVGAGVYISYGKNTTIQNCIFNGNETTYEGAGVYIYRGDATITNCTFMNNVSPSGYDNTLDYSGYGGLQVRNCVFWDLSRRELECKSNDSQIDVSYSNIKGGYPGFMNMDSDPLFTSANDGSLREDSPCIDAGTDLNAPQRDFFGNLRPGGGEYDMGAIESADWPTRTALYIDMPSHFFHQGDTVGCTATVSNPEPADNLVLLVVLYVYGSYYFAPSFSDFDFITFPYAPGQTMYEILPSFIWPSGAGSANQIYFVALLTDSDFNRFYGNTDIWEFGWNS